MAQIKIALNETGIVRLRRWGLDECEVGERLKGLVGDMYEVSEGVKRRRQVQRRLTRFGKREIRVRVRV